MHFRWKIDQDCPDAKEILTHPCEVNSKFRKIAEEKCSVLKGNLFKSCHSRLSPDQAYQDCLFDMCSCESADRDCLCPILATYYDECLKRGSVINWRQEVRECGIHCPTGQEYKQCQESSTYSCSSISMSTNISETICVEGCACPDDHTLDDKGNCIPIERCPCSYEGTIFEVGSKNFKPETSEICTCEKAKWICHPVNTEEERQLSSQASLHCNFRQNRILDNCPSEVLTCNNMHMDTKPTTECTPRCVCLPGYVENDQGICIPFKECPCHHGGKSYEENSKIKQKCNTW